MAALSSSTMARSSSASSFSRLLLLSLSLSLSSASKAIAKVDGGGKRRPSVASRMNDGAFQCRTCGRRFATFQALGGHRTSHKRPRVRADGLDLLLGKRPAGKACGGGRADARRAGHRCETCGKVFPTGQALGGHMRRHRPAGGEVPTTWSPTSGTTMAAAALSGLSEQRHDDDESTNTMRLIEFI